MYKVLSDASAEAIALVVWAAFWVCVWIECMRAIVLLEMNVRVVENVVAVEGMEEVLVVGASVVRVRSKYDLHAGEGVPMATSLHFMRRKVSSVGAGCE